MDVQSIFVFDLPVHSYVIANHVCVRTVERALYLHVQYPSMNDVRTALLFSLTALSWVVHGFLKLVVNWTESCVSWLTTESRYSDFPGSCSKMC